ncbi:MAG: TolC family protein [Candidatus Thiodiazotropha sp. (ex Lucinoma aequizonata)]|nr:TolC family protein [Candidatus Thiodiazotropha sp. (ex Lucinoma aequizonata)]MCU7887733.1 TolC family protein [Candidatus Thiodiazotropha sp. (ex Lucinoma aequizonata)]MCU7894353.1 TolC family protein [Candidatus Thiodiazotropha sp. (ex Lucinoma aequizonata)]MCU7900235.1 TolC family protein [Candidatus Thiodiazotropha sp. (ex Lucinoma aequizonata)]MCU7903075.1 TolC family protein [Candidatus Thiodiazotropha sp. (ex Lucinoma aequizonata)]
MTIGSQATGSEKRSSHDELLYQLATLVNQTIALNPEIQAAQAALNAAQANLIGTDLPLNNPEIEIEAERTDINTLTLRLSQTIDWHDKQAALTQFAQAELAVNKLNIDALKQTKASEILSAVSEISINKEISVQSARRSKLLRGFVQLAEQRFAAGDIAQSELELARLSLAEAMIEDTENRLTSIRARNDFLSLSGHTLENNINYFDRYPGQLPNELDDSSLAQHHPRVKLALQSAQLARINIHAINQQRKPDPNIGLSAGREDDEILLALSLSIPLQTRNDFRSSVDAAQALAIQAEQNAQQSLRNVLAAIKSARESYGLISDAWSQWTSLGRTSLEQHSVLLETQWQAGEMSTSEYLLQIKQAIDTRIAGLKLKGGLWNAWSTWLTASGTLNSWLIITAEER